MTDSSAVLDDVHDILSSNERLLQLSLDIRDSDLVSKIFGKIDKRTLNIMTASNILGRLVTANSSVQ